MGRKMKNIDREAMVWTFCAKCPEFGLGTRSLHFDLLRRDIQ
jgi:hypothetical protein